MRLLTLEPSDDWLAVALARLQTFRQAAEREASVFTKPEVQEEDLERISPDLVRISRKDGPEMLRWFKHGSGGGLAAYRVFCALFARAADLAMRKEFDRIVREHGNSQ